MAVKSPVCRTPHPLLVDQAYVTLDDPSIIHYDDVAEFGRERSVV
jgi:hypothetical protein